MSVDQMLWHVNQGLDATVGRIEPDKMRMPLPPAALKFMVLNLPWMKGAPTNPRFVATARHDFARELERCRQLIGEVAAHPSKALPANIPFSATCPDAITVVCKRSISTITCDSSACKTHDAGVLLYKKTGLRTRQ